MALRRQRRGHRSISDSGEVESGALRLAGSVILTVCFVARREDCQTGQRSTKP